MKKLVLIFSALISLLLLTSCTCGNSATVPATTTSVSQHDVKGEMSQ